MRKTSWAARFALAAWVGLALAGTVHAGPPMEQSLPDSTYLYVKIADLSALKDSVGKTSLGQLFQDPAWGPLKEEISGKLDDANNQCKQMFGMEIGELLSLPQGQVTIALVDKKDDPKVPVSLLMSVDSGKNEKKLDEVLMKVTETIEKEGNKVSNEAYQAYTLHIIRISEEKDQGKAPPFPFIWTKEGSIFHLATDVDALKDLLSKGPKRENSLAGAESYSAIAKKLGKDPQVFWYMDLGGSLKKAISVLAAQDNGAAQAQQIETMSGALGIGGLKAIGGAAWYNTGAYDRLSKTFLLTSNPQGILKLFPWPKSALKPEPWVPATVSSYQTMNWDLDATYATINDLANMFAPGALAGAEKNLGGPDGEGLSFEKDIVGPLGDRLTIISDYQKPITEKSQRVMFALALEDAKAFEKTLTKLFAARNLDPKKRDFQGTTVYDIPIPDNGNQGFQGPLSIAVAKGYLFISFGPTLLEQVLRGGPALADNPQYQMVAKEFPGELSGLSFVKPDEQLRQTYDMIKGGKLNNINAPNAPKIDFDMSKIPDFNVIAKYLSQGGGYMTQEDDGLVLTTFMLPKANP